MNNTKSINQGFTLIELLVSMSIISIISIAFFSTININIKSSSKNEKDISIINIAQTEIEGIREQIKSQKNITITDDKLGTKEVVLNELNTYSKLDTNIVNSNIFYIVNLRVNREKFTADKYIYTINISVEYKDKNISKRETNIEAKIFG